MRLPFVKSEDEIVYDTEQLEDEEERRKEALQEEVEWQMSYWEFLD